MTRSETDDTLQRLYCAEHGRLLRYFRTRVGREEAPDLLQEMFTRLLRNGALERVENPSAYLSRCARNLLIERWGRIGREQSIFLPFEDGRDASVCADQEFHVEAMELRRAYMQALRAMTPRTRRIFLMHRARHLTYKEIGERLGITQKAVQYHMARALARYRRVIALQS